MYVEFDMLAVAHVDVVYRTSTVTAYIATKRKKCMRGRFSYWFSGSFYHMEFHPLFFNILS